MQPQPLDQDPEGESEALRGKKLPPDPQSDDDLTVAPPLSHALVTREQRDLLCAMAYVSIGAGSPEQAVSLLSLILREISDDVEVLRLLAYALVASGNGVQALAALDRLASLEPVSTPAPLILLRSQALRLSGQLELGREAFRDFVERRRLEEEGR